ncbi:MAG TPA: winged helix-turn-helix domain-containing protein [Gaiellaceae bacterium]|nr:winged helix-turn-helix domain-containing protein [Gaiellaceae bacterium]
MIADVDVSPVAALLGDPARARIAQALHDGRALPASDLARRAGVAASTASEHLAKLVEGGLLAVERSGRHRYFRLASGEVAHAIEALAAVAPPARPRSLRQASVGEALAAARTCYDHLAGALGVALADGLLARGAIEERDGDFALGPAAAETLAVLGIPSLPARRPAVRRCLDWSERRPHVAGAFGAALCTRALEACWVERLPGSRAVRLTEAGRKAFASLGA